jgi:hypothetical protein
MLVHSTVKDEAERRPVRGAKQVSSDIDPRPQPTFSHALMNVQLFARGGTRRRDDA